MYSCFWGGKISDVFLSVQKLENYIRCKLQLNEFYIGLTHKITASPKHIC
jgi:hypothetical protein